MGLVELLRGQGKVVDVISKTHSASSRAGGVTADHYVRRRIIHGACKADAIWIDEIGQLGLELLAALNRLTYINVQLIMSGDFSQYAPIKDSWRGTLVPEDALATSRLLHTFAGGNRLRLVECKRSDRHLFDFYTRLIVGGDLHGQPVSNAVAIARQKFTYKGVCELNLVLSHRRRVALNKVCNLHFKPESGAIFIPCRLQKRIALNAPQPMWVWPGLTLVACLPVEKEGLRNGCEYVVKAVDETTVAIEKGPTLSHDQAVQWLRLPFCQTYASIQGKETNMSLALHDTDNPNFTWRQLYVGLSRARSAALVRVE